MENKQKMDLIAITFKHGVKPAEVQEVLGQFGMSAEPSERTYHVSVPAGEVLYHAKRILNDYKPLLAQSEATPFGRVFE